MTEKLVFDSAIEGLFLRGLGTRVTRELREALREVGIDLTKKLPPAVGYDAWYRALELTVTHCFAALSRPEAERELGRVMMTGIEHTFLGKTMAPAVKLLGPRRLIKKMPSNMKSANNFSTATVTELPGNALQVEVNDVGTMPGIMAGSLERMAAWAGARAVQVTVDAATPPAARYQVTWAD